MQQIETARFFHRCALNSFCGGDHLSWVDLRTSDLIDDGFPPHQARKMAMREWEEGAEV